MAATAAGPAASPVLVPDSVSDSPFTSTISIAKTGGSAARYAAGFRQLVRGVSGVPTAFRYSPVDTYSSSSEVAAEFVSAAAYERQTLLRVRPAFGEDFDLIYRPSTAKHAGIFALTLLIDDPARATSISQKIDTVEEAEVVKQTPEWISISLPESFGPLRAFQEAQRIASVPDHGNLQANIEHGNWLALSWPEVKRAQPITKSVPVAAVLTALFGYNTIAALITTITEPTMFLAGLTMVLAGLTILLARETLRRRRSTRSEETSHHASTKST